MKLKILFTLAILAGLAAAPTAQSTFRWRAGETHNADQVRIRVAERVSERVSRAVTRAMRQAERSWDRAVTRSVDRSVNRSVENALRLSDRTAASIERQINRQVEADVRRSIRASMGTWASGWNGSFDVAEVQARGDDCDNQRDRDDDYFQFCEEREMNLPGGALNVDASPNGGITVEASDRNDVHVTAVVRSRAASEARARELVSGVQVDTGGNRVKASGPSTSGREWWSVSYRVSVPRNIDLDLHSNNGGISIAGVSGRLEFDTNNGGVRLSEVGGDVTGRTRNGGLTVVLGGDRWDGTGLDVETTNGGVSLEIPEGYNAQLEARTRNGGVRTDFPITLTGELSMRNGISTTLGAGGAPVRVRTTNGGLKIGRR